MFKTEEIVTSHLEHRGLLFAFLTAELLKMLDALTLEMQQSMRFTHDELLLI
jgi:hypothetical protein